MATTVFSGCVTAGTKLDITFARETPDKRFCYQHDRIKESFRLVKRKPTLDSSLRRYPSKRGIESFFRPPTEAKSILGVASVDDILFAHHWGQTSLGKSREKDTSEMIDVLRIILDQLSWVNHETKTPNGPR